MALRVAGVAGAVVAVLWLMLDSGVSGAAAAPGTSGSLAALAVIFALGAFVMTKGGQPERAPLLVGLAAGVGGYAIARLWLVG
jgi:hypothetical protein